MRPRSSSTSALTSSPFNASEEKRLYSISALSRSDRIARSTPGYCTLTATSRPSGRTARCTWPIEAAATGMGFQSRKKLAGLVAELAADDPLRERGRHRRHVGLQRGERRLRFGRQAFGDEADQLARLHDGALHVPQLTGDVFGGADRELLLEGRSGLLVGSRSAHLHHGVVGAASSREPPDPRRSVEAIAAVCVGEGDPTGDRGRDQATSERCCGQPSRHRARRSQLAQVAQRTANGAACNRSSPIGPPQTSHVS